MSGGVSCEHLDYGNAQGKNVRSKSNRFFLCHFWWHVSEGTFDPAKILQVCIHIVVGRLALELSLDFAEKVILHSDDGEAKIGELGHSIDGEQDVLRFDVAVNDVFAVEESQAAGDLVGEVAGGLFVKLCILRDPLFKGFMHKFHKDVKISDKREQLMCELRRGGGGGGVGGLLVRF